MAALFIEIGLILILVLANGLFAMSEMAIVVARRSRLQELAESGDVRARTALDLATNPDRFLSTVQIGITLVGIFAGAFAGASIAEQIANRLAALPVLAPYADAIGLLVVVIGVTYLSLVLGELVPKRIAMSHSDRVAMAVARPMRRLARLASPLVSLLSTSTNAFCSLLGVRPIEEPTVTEEEIKVLVDQAARSGVLAEGEQDLVKSVFRFADRTVGALMTPRREVVWLDLQDGDDVNCRKAADGIYSRYLVADGSIDNLAGVVIAKEFLAGRLLDPAAHLQAYVRDTLTVPATSSALGMLDRFGSAEIRFAAVIDEHGSTVGLLTTDDILQGLVGELSWPSGVHYADVVRREDGSFLVDGAMLIDEFCEVFRLPELPIEHRHGFLTVAGFILAHLRRLPAVGEQFDWEGYRFEIIDMDGNRIDKVLIVQLDQHE